LHPGWYDNRHTRRFSARAKLASLTTVLHDYAFWLLDAHDFEYASKVTGSK
jgi:hypothetical protein